MEWIGGERPFPDQSRKLLWKSSLCAAFLGELFFSLPFRQLKMREVILMKLKLPLKEIRRHQRDPAKVWRVMLGTSFNLGSSANVPVGCPVNLWWTLNEGVHFLSRSLQCIFVSMGFGKSQHGRGTDTFTYFFCRFLGSCCLSRVLTVLR